MTRGTTVSCARRRRPSTAFVAAVEPRAPATTCTPAARSDAGESTGSIVAIAARTCAGTAVRSTRTPST